LDKLASYERLVTRLIWTSMEISFCC